MKKRNIWPFIGAILLTIANGDWIITPLVMKAIDKFWVQFFILAGLLNLELILWYKFWHWFIKFFLTNRKKIRETIDFTREITKELKKELKDKEIIDRIIDYFEQNFEWAVHPDRWFIKLIKTGSKIFGHFLMFFLGIEPFIQGGRFTGIIICVSIGFRSGLYSLIIGNCGHILINMGMWNLTFYFWDNFKAPFIVVLSVFMVFVFIKQYSIINKKPL